MNKVYEDIKEYIIKNNICRIFIDMDGTVCEFSYQDKVNIDKWLTKGMFVNRRPLKSIINILKRLQEETDCTLIILSACPNNIISKEKYEWLHVYMPFIKDKDVILVGNSEYKINTMNEVMESCIPNSQEDKSNILSWVREQKIYYDNKLNMNISVLEVLKKTTLIIDDTHSILFQAEKEGYHAFHVSKLVE